MYNLIVKHNGQIIVHRVLTPDELSTLQGSGTIQLVINAFIKYLGLDIRSYGLNEFENPLTNKSRSFTIYIRNEDLEKLRDNKLNKLGL